MEDNKYTFLELENKLTLIKHDPDELKAFYSSFIDRYNELDKKYGFTESMDIDYIFHQIHQKQNILNRPLACMPFGIKDIFNTRVLPTTMGSELWKGFKAGNNARIVDELEDQGAISFSKTTSAEFAVHFITPQKTINPWNPDHITGTSSSGSAVAVASGALPIALGTQTAGSLIRPASFCGIFGFKPSFGAIDRTGTLKTNDLFDTIGFLGSDIYGLMKTFSCTMQKTKDYPMSKNYIKNYELSKLKKKPKIGIVTSVFKGYANYAEYVKQAFNKTIEDLNSIYDIHFIDDAVFINEVHPLHELAYCKSLSYYFKEEIKVHKKVSEIMTKMIREGDKISTSDFMAINSRKVELTEKFDKVFEDYDFILTPSTASGAPKLDEVELNDTCLIWTFFGYPTISLPIYLNKNLNLPFGLQLVGKRYYDFALLDFANSLSKHFAVELGSTAYEV